MQDGTYVMTEAGLESLMKVGGYWVAFEETTLDDVAAGDVVGVWTDNLTGKVWIDKSMYVEDLATAMTLGRTYNQKAIYDIVNSQVLTVA